MNMAELHEETSLNVKQYTESTIHRCEKIYGRGFVSTGGLETTKEFVGMLDLKPGEQILDVGCGIGGSAFYMCKNFGVDVLAVDLSAVMINFGQKRAVEEQCADKVKFAVADITTAEYEPASFDVIYSRDVIMHIKEKENLFTKFHKWLKPGGKLFISEYCHGDQDLSDGFKAYLKQRHYHTITVKAYEKLLEKVGFVDVKAEDKTEMLKSTMKRELTKVKRIKDEFINSKELCQNDYDHLVDAWSSKLVNCDAGDHKWGAFYAIKK